MTRREGRGTRSVVALLELVDALLEVVELDDEGGDGEEDPVEEQRGGDEEGVALGLHDGLLVAEVLGGGAGVLVVAGGPHLVLPVDVHEQEEAEGHHRHHGLERAPHDGDHPAPERVQTRQRQQQQHDGLRARRVPQHHPLQRHRAAGPLAFRFAGDRFAWGRGFGSFTYTICMPFSSRILQTQVIYKSLFHYTSGMCRSAEQTLLYRSAPPKNMRRILSIYLYLYAD